MNMHSKIMTSLFLGVFAFFSLGLSGYFGNWSDWMYRYMPKKETVMSYADPQQAIKNKEKEGVENKKNENDAYLDYLITEKKVLDELDEYDQSLYHKQKGLLHRIYDMSQYKGAIKAKEKNKNIFSFISILRNEVHKATNEMTADLLSVFNGGQEIEKSRLEKLSLSALVKEYDQKSYEIIKKKIELSPALEQK